MESTSSHNVVIVAHSIRKMIEACDLVTLWNNAVSSVDDYLGSPDGMQKMAASCMLIESIGEGVKKIDRLMPGFLNSSEPDVQWRNIKGLRDHIAHGYFNIDADIVFDVAINEIPGLKDALTRILAVLTEPE